MAAKTKKQLDDEFKEEMASGIHYVRSQRACGHQSLVQDYLDMRGRQYKVGPQPHSERCITCLGPFTDEQIEDRQRWRYQLLHSIHVVHKKAILDREIDLLRALKVRFGGEEIPA